jgi:uncharacterized protein (TIGR03437 family)
MRVFCVFAACAALAWAQAPAIFPGGVVNAASFLTGGQTGAYLAPGSIASIFGTNLANVTESAASTPLPTELGGTSVTVGGVAAPLFYVSPGQINLQIPSAFDTGQVVSGQFLTNVVVQTSAGSSAAYQIDPGVAFGLFTENASGCGQAAALNVSPSGAIAVNSPANSASPGDYLSVFGTGLGPALAPSGLTLSASNPPDGSPAPSDPPVSDLEAEAGFLIDLPNPSVSDYLGASGSNAAAPSWYGLAPGLVGVDQVNFRIPEGTREGCAVPIIADSSSTGGTNIAYTPPVTIAIRNGGGPCVDPPFAAYGQVTWSKTVATGTESDGETDTVTVSLQGSPGRQAPPPPTYSTGGIYVNSRILVSGPSCPVAGYRSLDAGAVSAQGPSFAATQAATVPVPAPDNGQVAGLTEYRAALATNSVQAGAFSISAQGGADVGAFQSTLQAGSDIQITTSLTRGTVLDNQFTITWTGGDPTSWVTVKVLDNTSPVNYYGYAQAQVSAGQITFVAAPTMVYPPATEGPFEIDIEVDPDPSQIAAFSAPGLSLGGQATWKYLHRFGGITIQEGN